MTRIWWKQNDELRQCSLLLTNDTGTMHLAALLGVPVVAVFGSTEPRLTGPLGNGHIILRHHVECSPCFLRECPIDFRCMRAIPVAAVIQAGAVQCLSKYTSIGHMADVVRQVGQSVGEC